MKYQEFKELMDLWKKLIDYEDSVHAAKLIHEDIFDEHNKFIDKITEKLFTKNGIEWVCWFVYDTDFQRGKKYDAHDMPVNGKEKKICQNVKGLYDYLNKNNYFKNLNNGHARD